MFVFEVIVPGTWLDYEDREWAWKIQNQLDSLQSRFFEANLALNLFTSTKNARTSLSIKDTWDTDTQRKQEIRNEIEMQLLTQGKSWHEIYDEVSLQTDIIFKREKWQQGSPPAEFEHKLVFLYAQAFLYALDGFAKFLAVLSKEDNVPETILDIHRKMLSIFPDLIGVRNTAQHLEDRSRGLGAGKNPKSLDLKPINNGFIYAPNGGALILNGLNGSKYGATKADGYYGEIDVSPDSMVHLQEILHDVLNSFKWNGPKQHKPSN